MQSRSLIQRLAWILPLVQSNKLPILGVVLIDDKIAISGLQSRFQITADHLQRRLDPAFRADKQSIVSVVRAGEQEANTLQRAQVRSTQNRLLERAQDRSRRATGRSFRDRRVVKQARHTPARRSARISSCSTSDHQCNSKYKSKS